MIDKNKIYFQNLNAIRFIAAFLVIICHIEELKDFFNIERIIEVSHNKLIGRIGVVMFFVLSGFLITFLLYTEKEVTKTINIKKFYIRRILRIWPLYFLIIFFTFFIVPFLTFFVVDGYDKNLLWFELPTKIALFIFFLPNLACAIYGTIPYAAITWSIGVEEQFYLIWPILNKKIKNKWLIIFCVIITYLLIKRYIFYLPTGIKEIVKIFWDMTLINCMAIGAMFATILYNQSKFIKFLRGILYLKIVQWLVLFFTFFLVLINYKQKDFYCEIYSLLFGILIFNFASNPNRIFSMENKFLNYLGKISYGIYIYHYILIIVTLRIFNYYNFKSDFFLYFISISNTIVVASLSYTFFEKRFIDKKIKYSDVLSGDNALK